MNSPLALLREARLRQGYSQVHLAGLSGVSLPTIQQIEAGTANPSFEIVARLARVLGLRVSIGAESPDWEVLAACGVPVTAKAIVVSPNPELLCTQLRLACTEIGAGNGNVPDGPRKAKALQATVWALSARYPAFYAKHFGGDAVVNGFLPKTPSGALIKLRRIVMAEFAKYL